MKWIKGEVILKLLNQSTRYEFLRSQFSLDSQRDHTEEMEKSLNRIFSFVYEHTKIMSIGFIDEKICCSYLKFHHSKNFEEITFTEALKDIKNLNYFVHHIKEYKNVPKIKLSLKNYSFWLKLDER